MWTYRHPFKSLNATPESIRYHAQTELFRAVNTGRTVAFVGSGLTTPYGRLSWGEFARVAVLECDGLYVELVTPEQRSLPPEATEIRRAIWAALNKYDPVAFSSKEEPVPIALAYTDEVPADIGLLQLCEDLVEALGQPDFLRALTARVFNARSASKFSLRVLMLCGKCKIYNDLIELLGDDDRFLDQKLRKSHPPFNSDNYIEWFSSFDWRAALAEFENFLGKNSRKESFNWKDFFKRIHESGRVGLDVDEEDPIADVSSMFRIEHFITLNYDNEIERFFKRHHDFAVVEPSPGSVSEQFQESPYGTRLRIDSVDGDRLSSLAEFAILPAISKSSILHAHGHANDEESLIITERDYQTRYLSSHASRQAFEEALTMLFRGNHILFVGIGMSESDLLRPLRQFMADRDGLRRMDASAIAIMRGEPIWHPAFDATENSIKKIEVCEQKALAKQTLQAINLQSQFGVKSYYSEQQFRAKAKSSSEGVGSRWSQSRMKKKLERLNEDVSAARNDARLFGRTLEILARRQQRWQQYVARLPRPRQAIFADKTFDVEGGVFRIWARQRIVLRDNQKLYPTTEFRNAIAAAPLSGPAYLKFWVPKGHGKGSILRSLQENVHNIYKNIPNRRCLSAFFADTRFSTEFNSVPIALLRFLDGILAYDKDSLEFCRAGNLKIIRRAERQDYSRLTDGARGSVFELLQARLFEVAERINSTSSSACGHGRLRLLFCFGGVDRLTDEQGHFRNGVHRRFFRLLMGQDEFGGRVLDDKKSSSRAWPFDFLFISSSDIALSDLRGETWNWKRVEAVPLERRTWLMVPDGNQELAGGTELCKIASILGNSPEDSMISLRQTSLGKVMDGNVAIDFWSRSLVRVAMQGENRNINRHIRQIDAEASRDGQDGALSGILKAFHGVEKTDVNEGGGKWRLRQLVLRHLAIFPIPVERRVLATCPEIDAACREIDPDGKTNVARILQDQALDQLQEIGLVVRCAPSGPESSESSESASRYTIHEGIREYLGREMGYPLASRYYSMSYDVSLYSAETGDRPAPRAESFLFVARIIQKIIKVVQSRLQVLVEKEHFERSARNRLEDFDDARLMREVVDQAGSEGRPSQTRIRAGLHGKVIEESDAFSFETYSRWANRVFDELNRAARDQYLAERAGENAKQLQGQFPLERGEELGQVLSWLIRAAASILMAGLPIQTISRLRRVDVRSLEFEESDHALDIYGSLIRSVLNAATALTRNSEALSGTTNIREPLYRSEIIWLVNERAIVSHVQGRMDDALAGFKSAVSASLEMPWGHDQGECLSEAMSSLWGIRLNQAIARMEAGKLRQARRSLDRLLDIRDRDRMEGRPASLVLELANGWAGVNDYYRGNLVRGENRLKEVVSYLESAKDNLRGLSIFRRFQAQTWFRTGRTEDALKRIDLSIEAANAGDHRDLVYLSAVAKAKMLIDMDDQQSLDREDAAIELIERAESYADRMGMPRLEMLSKVARASSMAKRHHFDQAGKLLGEAIAIGNLNGLEIHKAVALAHYALVLRERARSKGREGQDDLRLAERIEQANEFNSAAMGFALSMHQPKTLAG